MAAMSFLVAYRDRPRQLEGFVHSIRRWFGMEAEIIIAEQANQEEFLQGQLLNLAYLASNGALLVLMDVDIRFQQQIDLVGIMEERNHPFVAYDRIINCTVDGESIGERKGANGCFGGCAVLTRQQFEDSCGYSNLLRGWGADDTILNDRVGGFDRIYNTVLHVAHGRRKQPETYDKNLWICRTESQRDKGLDGFHQTTAELVRQERKGNIVHLFYDQIGVTSDYCYTDLWKGLRT